MDIQKSVGSFAGGLQHRKAETDIGNKMAVHDIKVQSPCVFYPFDLFP